MRVRLALCGAVLLCPIVAAQDAVKVDPQHYTVVSENDQVRILKAHYGPHEKSVMHSHPATVAVFLTDAKGHFTFPDGKKQDFDVKAGQSQYQAANPATRAHVDLCGTRRRNIGRRDLRGHLLCGREHCGTSRPVPIDNRARGKPAAIDGQHECRAAGGRGVGDEGVDVGSSGSPTTHAVVVTIAAASDNEEQ